MNAIEKIIRDITENNANITITPEIQEAAELLKEAQKGLKSARRTATMHKNKFADLAHTRDARSLFREEAILVKKWEKTVKEAQKALDEAVATATPVAPKKRGRPVGSKNKPKDVKSVACNTTSGEQDSLIVKDKYGLVSPKDRKALEELNAPVYERAKLPQYKAQAEAIINEGMKMVTMTGWPFFLAPIPSELVVVDLYQRPLNKSKVNKAVNEFNPDGVQTKTVNYRPEEGVFALVDGQHLAEILRLKGQKLIPCRVFYGRTYEQEAALFATQDDGSTDVNRVHKFRAKLEAGFPLQVMCMEVMTQYGLKWGYQRRRKTVTAITKVEKIAEDFGRQGLELAFKVLVDAGWESDPHAYSESGLNVGYYAFESCSESPDGDLYGHNYKLLINILRQYKTSREFVDYCNYICKETYTKHPEYAVREVMPCIFDGSFDTSRRNERIIKVK